MWIGTRKAPYLCIVSKLDRNFLLVKHAKTHFFCEFIENTALKINLTPKYKWWKRENTEQHDKWAIFDDSVSVVDLSWNFFHGFVIYRANTHAEPPSRCKSNQCNSATVWAGDEDNSIVKWRFYGSKVAVWSSEEPLVTQQPRVNSRVKTHLEMSFCNTYQKTALSTELWFQVKTPQSKSSCQLCITLSLCTYLCLCGLL